MEKSCQSLERTKKQFSYKYLVASALFILLYSCTKPNLPESKNNHKEIQPILLPSLLNDSSLSSNSGLVCNINDVGSIANGYIKAGKYNEAIDLLLSAQDSLLKIQNDTINPYLGTIYDNLGNVYNCVKDTESSIKYYQKSIDMARLDGNTRSLLFRLNNLSTTYLNKQEYDKAIPLLKEAYLLLENNSETLGKETYLVYLISLNLSNSYVGIGDFLSAKKYFLKAKYIVEHNTFSFYEIGSILTSEADFAIYEKDYKKAFSLYEESLNLYKKNGDIDGEEWVLRSMKNLAISLKDYPLAYDYQTKEFNVTKKIISNENEKERAEIETKYGLLAKQREIDRQQSEIKLQKQKTKAARTVGGLAFALAFVLGGAVIVYGKQKKEISKKNQALEIANNQIKEKNQELEQSNEEIRTINDELNEKNQIIEKANAETTASITYASFIQKSFLSSNIKKHFPDSFLYYQPRDIVGGDLYFADELSDGRKILIAGDCTGHGVPGGFLVSFSVDSIKNLSKTAQKPSDIINGLDCKFMENYSTGLETSTEKTHLNDSMDVSCIFYTPETRLLEYSISSRSILLLRKGEFIRLSPEIRADVGSTKKHPLFTEYKTYTQQLEPGDEIFLSSDGVSDQFNNKTDRKFGVKPFYSFLQTLSTLPMAERSVYTTNFYNKLKENKDGTKGSQTDDILLVGFKV